MCPAVPAWCPAPRAPAPRAALPQGRAGLLVQNGRSSSSSSRASGNASSDSALPPASGATLAAALARAKSPEPSPPPPPPPPPPPCHQSSPFLATSSFGFPAFSSPFPHARVSTPPPSLHLDA